MCALAVNLAATPRLPSAAPAQALELAGELRKRADSLDATFSQFEQTCVDGGARLGDALPSLSVLATTFETLSGALESEALSAAGADLNAVAAELTKSVVDLDEERRALAELIDLNREIGAKIVLLLECMRTLSALVFTLKVEAAPLQTANADMTAFADRLHTLTEHARNALVDYSAIHGVLDTRLRAAADAQTSFGNGHRDGLNSIAAEIRASLGAVGERRRRIIAGLRKVGARTRDIRDRVGECVAALQIGDSTRQRVEHVHRALYLFANLADGRPSAAADDDAVRLFETHPQGFAARLCHLQALQVRGALEEFTAEIQRISGALKSISRQVGALVQEGRDLFGADDSASGSFLQSLEQKLGEAHRVVGERQRARVMVDKAASAVISTMTDLRQRTDALLEIVVDIAMIGTNALLKANRLGDCGKGISVIAYELHHSGDEISDVIHALPTSLKRLATSIDRLHATCDSDRLSKLGERMSVAVQSFAANGRQMAAALDQLIGESKAVGLALDHTFAALSSGEQTVSFAKSATKELEALADSGKAGEPARIDSLLDRLVRPTYTMASERRIHDEFTGFAGIDASAPQVGPPSEDTDSFML
jgi:hypothetical protein